MCSGRGSVGHALTAPLTLDVLTVTGLCAQLVAVLFSCWKSLSLLFLWYGRLVAPCVSILIFPWYCFAEARSLGRRSLEARQEWLTTRLTVYLCHSGPSKVMNIHTMLFMDFVCMPLNSHMFWLQCEMLSTHIQLFRLFKGNSYYVTCHCVVRILLV